MAEKDIAQSNPSRDPGALLEDTDVDEPAGITESVWPKMRFPKEDPTSGNL